VSFFIEGRYPPTVPASSVVLDLELQLSAGDSDVRQHPRVHAVELALQGGGAPHPLPRIDSRMPETRRQRPEPGRLGGSNGERHGELLFCNVRIRTLSPPIALEKRIVLMLKISHADEYDPSVIA
jgi:hypothetical protein